jgi:hypothetical protein
LRDDYWSRVRGFGVDPAGKVFIDKGPFNTPRLAVIRRLFPKAKILFAVRDPRDVVLSSFRRRFRINPTTFALLDLEDSAHLYAATMQFADSLRGKIAIDEYMLIYERLIADFDTEARAVCDFIGVMISSNSPSGPNGAGSIAPAPTKSRADSTRATRRTGAATESRWSRFCRS